MFLKILKNNKKWKMKMKMKMMKKISLVLFFGMGQPFAVLSAEAKKNFFFAILKKPEFQNSRSKDKLWYTYRYERRMESTKKV